MVCHRSRRRGRGAVGAVAGAAPAAAAPGRRRHGGFAQLLEPPDGGDVPVARQAAEQLLEPDRDLDVGQRVTVEAGEGRRVGDRPAEQLGVHRRDRGRLPGERGLGAPGRCRPVGEVEQRRVVGLAVGQPPVLVDGHDAHGVPGKAAVAGDVAPQPFPVDHAIGAAGADDDEPVASRAAHVVPRVTQPGLEGVEVDAMAEHLDEPGAAAHHAQQPLRSQLAEVAGAQPLDGAPQGQVGRAVGVPEHDVGAFEDDLAVLDGDLRARHRVPHGVRVLRREVGGQAGHPGGRLGLPVHDDEVPAAPLTELGQAPDPLGLHPPACLGQVAQPRQVAVGEATALEQLEGVGHSRDGRDARPGGRLPEALVDDGVLGQEDARPGGQVRLQHREPVGVGQRQGEGGAVVGADVERGPDLGGVGHEVVAGEPHQLPAPGGAAGAEQEREVRVQVVGRVLTQDVDHAVVGDDHVGRVGRPQPPTALARWAEQHGVAPGLGTEEGGHRAHPPAGLHLHQSPRAPDPLRHLGRAGGEVGVRHHRPRGVQRGSRTVPAQPVDPRQRRRERGEGGRGHGGST